MAYKTRATLINKNGKDMINLLKENFPDIEWYLTLRDGREVCVGIRDGRIVVIGSTYETITDNLAL
jgi:hypothetical protein